MLLTIILIVAAFIFGYFVGANNPLSSVKKKIEDKAGGLLNKVPIVAIPLLLLFASCHPALTYDNAITGRSIAQQVRQQPLDAPTLDSLAAGLVDTVLIHANTVDIYNIADSIYTIEKTHAQNAQDFWDKPWRVWTAAIGAVLVLGAILLFIIATSKGGGLAWMSFLIPVVIGCVMLGGSIYPFSDEGQIPKWQYQKNKAATGDQRDFDWDHLKTY